MYNIVMDEFNSNIFEINMGNIVIDKDFNNTISIDAVLDEATNKQIDHLSIKIDANNLKLCNIFLNKGFYIVDTLVSYRFDYEKNNIPEYFYSSDFKISDFEKNDVECISKIAYKSFFNDRFHNDPYLANELCNSYYEQWIKNSCNGFADMVLVCKDNSNNEILGFGTGKYNNIEESSLVLNAVTESSRGRGVYTALIYEAMKRYKGKSRYLYLGTQINNFAVQKAWGKLGFQIFDSKYVLHKKLV